MPDDTVELLEERSGGMCEAGCGRRAEDIHHRRFLSRCGKHNLANLVALCGDGNHNNGKCHGLAHQGAAAPPGWAISRHERRHEAEVPFVDLAGRSWWFDDHGNKFRTQPRKGDNS